MWMDMAVLFGFPFLIVMAWIAHATYRNYLRHKERMAMIEKGMVPADFRDEDEPYDRRHEKASPITVTLVGVALTLGLLTLGIGPWLLGGLIPTAIGCAMLINQMRKESAKTNGKGENKE